MKKQKGITLVALVLTIIILLILAGISISALTNQGLFTRAQEAKNVTEEKTAEENETLANYVEQVDTAIGKAKIQNVSASTSTTHTATAITFNWEELSSIAKMISNTSTITNDTAEVEVQTNLGVQKLGVGDTTTLDGKKVRILGFNHDTLTSETAYGEKTATGQAGISFEYVEFLTSAAMNSSDTTDEGWGACTLRTTLNSTTYESLSIKDKIKQVNKEFIETYDDVDSKTTSGDYLWLLSCGEIWSSGNGGGVARGYAIATEGSQYKYYKIGNPEYSSESDFTKKPNTSSPMGWSLRSPVSDDITCYCAVLSGGSSGEYRADSESNIAPCFSI